MRPESQTLDLASQASLARILREALASAVGDDASLWEDTLEGQTGLFEAVDRALERLADLESFEQALRAQEAELAARRARYMKQAASIRGALQSALRAANLRRIERAAATVWLRGVAPQAVITDEAAVPAEYLVIPAPRPDLRAISQALKEGREVPGARLEAERETIAIRRT